MIVDTTFWVDCLNGISTPKVGWLDRKSERQRLGLVDLTVCEMLQGVSTIAAAAQVLRTSLSRRRPPEAIAICAPCCGLERSEILTPARDLVG